jgi:tetratricopeptide (TPR) repeat protein
MSLNQTLTRARACVQRGQVDAAIKLYRGLLVSMAHHPQINTELGVLLLQHRRPQDAVPFLQKAVSALPTAVDYWALLILAHQRSGDVHAARAVLADMHTQGFAAAQLTQYEQELNEPPPEDLQALEQMLGQQQWVNAEIAARMMVNDYPDSATAQACLQRVLQQGEPLV